MTMPRTRLDLEDKRAQEKDVVGKMIRIYCKGHKHSRAVLCPDCLKLLSYAQLRIDRCPFIETKTFCSNCKAHCYRRGMRQRIKEVMRYSGPWMLLYHPVLTIRHVIEGRRQRQAEKGVAP
ncbi:MAG: nitrous oxide-stimulated promoter family protein [Firmicutes bacterium]|nr:nitrous oxide-stimulated promoter family protein [Bacillota bacterium]